MQQFVDLGQSGLKDDRSCRFGGDVTVLTKRDTSGCGEHCGSVIDAVAQEQGGGLRGPVAHDLELLLRPEAGTDVSDANDLRRMLDFEVPVARENDGEGPITL